MTAKWFLFVTRSLIACEILNAYALKAKSSDPNVLLRDCMRSLWQLCSQFSCHYVVVDNRLKIRSLREIGIESGCSAWLDGRCLWGSVLYLFSNDYEAESYDEFGGGFRKF